MLKFNVEIDTYFGVGLGIGYSIDNGLFIFFPFVAITFTKK